MKYCTVNSFSDYVICRHRNLSPLSTPVAMTDGVYSYCQLAIKLIHLAIQHAVYTFNIALFIGCPILLIIFDLHYVICLEFQ